MSAPSKLRSVPKFALGLALALAGASTAQAQWWGWGYHASTPAEGYARGLADLVRSEGEANWLNSRAALRFEQARAANFENRLKYAQMFFDRRRAHDEYMRQERAEGRYQREMARPQPLEPLTAAERDPRTGKIHWPGVLMTEALAESRERFDELSALRSQEGNLDFEAQHAVRQQTRAMTDELRDAVGDYTPSQYAEAKRFITRLSGHLRAEPAAAVARTTAPRSATYSALAVGDADRLVVRD